MKYRFRYSVQLVVFEDAVVGVIHCDVVVGICVEV